MKTIIFCNTIKGLNKLLKHKGHKVIKYIVFTYNAESGRLIEFLENNPTRFISAVDFPSPKKFSQNFQNKFVNFIANLNQQNHSYYWWGLRFTNKSPITTHLCNKAFNLLSVADLVDDSYPDTILVVTDDVDLLKQFQIYAKDRQTEIINAISSPLNIKDVIKYFTPLAIFSVFFRTLAHSIYAKVYCRLKLDKLKGYTIILSLLNQQSFTKEGVYRDTYFGSFVYYLKKKNVSFINLAIVNTPLYRHMLKKVYSQESNIPIVTVEYFLNIFDLLSCLYHSLIKYFTPVRTKGEMNIDGIDLSYLVKRTIRKDYASTYFYYNLRMSYAIKSLSKRIKINRFYYPFENRSFERMTIMSLRKFSPETKIIGYQHASLSLRHTNFLLGKEEYRIIPLPDVILTIGGTTLEIMAKIGNFPEGLLRVGGALRQSVFKGAPKEKNKRISNILVALASDLVEYVKVLRFLDKALSGFNSYQLWIRSHPTFSLEDAIKIAGKISFKFYKADKETLDECYQWADIILYVHSTLAIESIMRGIPVLNIVVPDALDPDPLFNFDDFKWRVDTPSDLIPTINRICSMNKEEFIARQKRAHQYANKYIHKVDELTLEDFLKC